MVMSDKKNITLSLLLICYVIDCLYTVHARPKQSLGNSE